MKIVLYCRGTEDWANVTLDTRTVGGRINSKTRDKIKLWDDTCDLPYFEYRRLIHEIARENWANITDHFWFKNPADLIWSLNDEDLIIPTDDDDWLCSDLKHVLPRRIEDYIYWNSVTHRTRNFFQLGWWYRNHDCPSSNNYAVRAGFAKRLVKHYKYKIMDSHGSSLKIANQNGGQVSPKLEKHLSCYNWHAGSASVLSHVVNRENLLNLLPKGKMGTIPNNVSWISPHCEKFWDVLKHLKPKSVKLL